MRKNAMANERIRKVREALGLTQRQFAPKIGIAQTAISMLETGNNTVTDKVIKIICSELGVNEKWMRTGKGEMFKASPNLKELGDILVNLTPETQQYLLLMARELLNVQEKLLNKNDDGEEHL